MNKGLQAENVLAVPMGQIAHAFATGIDWVANSHIVPGANPGAVNRKTATADFTGNLF